jgi:hypothetical protein
VYTHRACDFVLGEVDAQIDSAAAKPDPFCLCSMSKWSARSRPERLPSSALIVSFEGWLPFWRVSLVAISGSLVGGSANRDCDALTRFMAGRGGSVTGMQSALLILIAALTSSWLIVSPASARRIIGSLTSAGASISSRAVQEIAVAEQLLGPPQSPADLDDDREVPTARVLNALRQPDIADRGRGRRSWADCGPQGPPGEGPVTAP